MWGQALVRPSDNLSDALKLLSDALQILSLRMSAIDPIRARIAGAAMRAADYAVDPAKDHVNLAADDVCRLAVRVSNADAHDPLECGAVATAIELNLRLLPSHV